MNTQNRCSVCFSRQLLSLDSESRSVCTFCLRPGVLKLSSGSTSHTSHTREIIRRNGLHVPRIFQSYEHVTTIDTLPENILIGIFDFYRNNFDNPRLWKWYLLVHVCRRWRQIVFSSPLRLNLRILCTSRTRVEENLSIWPNFPIDIEYSYSRNNIKPRGEDNVIAALKHPDRVCDVSLSIEGSQLGRMVTVMKKPFPVLTRLHIRIRADDSNVLVLPQEFLGTSAPCLRKIALSGIPYPTLPMLLLSASNLVTLELHRIPPTGYISPRAMVTCLAALPRLSTVGIQFQSAIPRPGQIRPALTRTVLPALTSFEFKGASEYLEGLVTQIDSPQLDHISVVYLNQFVDLQVVQLTKFIERSVVQIAPFRYAQVNLSGDRVSLDMCRHDFPRRESHPTPCLPPIGITISCRGIGWQVSHIAQVLSHFSATFISNVVRLKLESPDHKYPQLARAEWLPLLGPFAAVQTLHASKKLAKYVSQALEDITQEAIADVLPSLNLIDLEGQLALSVEKFVTARRISGHPVTVADFKKERARVNERGRERERQKAILEREKEWELEKVRVGERQREQERNRVRDLERVRERETKKVVVGMMLQKERDRVWPGNRTRKLNSEWRGVHNKELPPVSRK